MNGNYLFSVFPNERFIDLGIYQYGWEKCEPLHSFGPCIRNHYLFHYVISGTGVLDAGGSNGGSVRHLVKGGEGFMIFPRQVTTYFADKDHPWEYTWVEFDGLRVKEALDQAGLMEDNPVYRSSSKELTQELKNEMLYIVRNPKQSPLNLVGHLYLFLDYLVSSSVSRRVSRGERLQDYYVREAIHFIEQNFQNDITVEDIAASCSLNRSYFGKIFRDAVGRTPQSFLIEYRMSRASKLLKLTELPIKDISNAVGYPSQLHFSRAFKNTFGMPPREWRLQNRRAPEER